MLKHLNVKIAGKVQGVFFRASTKQMADLLGVDGFVRNESDGAVYLEAEGEDESVFKLIHWCHHGPDNAVVEQVSVTEGEMKGYTGFEIRR